MLVRDYSHNLLTSSLPICDNLSHFIKPLKSLHNQSSRVSDRLFYVYLSSCTDKHQATRTNNQGHVLTATNTPAHQPTRQDNQGKINIVQGGDKGVPMPTPTASVLDRYRNRHTNFLDFKMDF